MGRKFTPEEASPFYPPRARWFSVLFYAGIGLRRRLALDRLRMPRGMKAGELAAGFFVPGLAVYFRGPRLWARGVLAACITLGLAYVIWLGYPAANVAFGLLLSIHATGFVHYCKPLMAGEPFRSRLSFTLLVLIGISLLLYLPARSFVQGHLLTPMRLDGQVLVVQRVLCSPVLHRGDWAAYSLADLSEGEAHNGGAVQFAGGAGLGPVLAVAGDRVAFSGAGFSVNGVLQGALPHMPHAGEWIVPEKHWFIWPNIAISGHGNVSEDTLSRTFLRLADVAPGQFLGRPFHRWFWRTQTLP